MSSLTRSTDEGTTPRARGARLVKIAGWIGAGTAFLLVVAATVRWAGLGLTDDTGRSWKPAPVWQGNGVLAANGATYRFYVKIRFERKHEGANPTVGKTNLIGIATICAPHQIAIELDVSGTMDAWWVENGKAVTLYLRPEKKSDPKLFFLLYGSWQGTELVLEDRGTLENFFKTYVRTKNPRRSSKGPMKTAEVTLHYGEKSEFERACPAIQNS